ncbi:MAG: type IV pili methyl-accepting chemotaxis transducer N-terminal domain-containing protein [Pseudomonadota bacterium]
MPTRRAVVAGVTAAAVSLVPSVPLLAATGGATQDRRRINLVSRQRMLSQQIGRAALFAAVDVEQSRHLEMLETSATDFAAGLANLRDGTPELELDPETDAAVLATLAQLDALWQGAALSIGDILENQYVPDAQIRRVAGQSAALTDATGRLMRAMLAKSSVMADDTGLTVSIDIAGRQQMLSQKMAKDSALIALGVEIEETRDALDDTVALFDNSLRALIEGMPTVTLPPPPERIRLKLLEISESWQGYAALIGAVASSGIASNFELFAVAAQVDPLVAALDEVVRLYETA